MLTLFWWIYSVTKYNSDITPTLYAVRAEYLLRDKSDSSVEQGITTPIYKQLTSDAPDWRNIYYYILDFNDPTIRSIIKLKLNPYNNWKKDVKNAYYYCAVLDSLNLDNKYKELIFSYIKNLLILIMNLYNRQDDKFKNYIENYYKVNQNAGHVFFAAKY